VLPHVTGVLGQRPHSGDLYRSVLTTYASRVQLRERERGGEAAKEFIFGCLDWKERWSRKISSPFRQLLQDYIMKR
jgi:hypothetical protein